MAGWVYYNEIDAFAAEWLRRLISSGHIAPGVVDERSIAEVDADELREFTQCHFFAGIGGWSRAARLAGWPDDRPLWTGSCPCQPFSTAGRRRATDDERHLWPEFYRFIAERRPAIVAGEQVASRLGRDWLSGVRADLEAVGYAVGGADLCAAGVGAPHIRQRLWWGGYADEPRPQGRPVLPERTRERASGAAGMDGGVGHSNSERAGWDSGAGVGAQAEGSGRGQNAGRVGDAVGASGSAGGLADADRERCDRERLRLREEGRERGSGHLPEDARRGAAGFWDDSVWIPCADGKARRIEPSIDPLAHGVSARVGRLRAYGNAIVPQVAAEFLKACDDAARALHE